MDNLETSATALSSQRSIVRTFTLWTILLSLVPLSIFAFMSYQASYKGAIKLVDHELKSSSDLAAKFIDNWFADRVLDLKTQASSPRNRQLLQSLSDAFLTSGLPLPAFVESQTWTTILGDSAVELENIVAHYGHVYDLFLIDKRGNVLYTVKREDDFGTNLMDGPYADTRFGKSFQASLNRGELVFSDKIRYAPSNNVIAGFLVSPVTDDTGAVLGAFAMQIEFDRVIDALNTDKDESIAHYIVGDDGVLRSPIGGNSDNILLQKLRTEPVTRWRDSPDDAKLSQVSHYTGPEQKRVIGMLHPLAIADINWALVSEIDEDEALSSVKSLAQTTLTLESFTVLIVAILAYLLIRRVTQPILMLRDAVMDSAAGVLKAPIKINTNNEISTLAAAFNHLIESRNKQEKALVESESQMQLVLDSTGVGIWNWNIQSGETQFNDRWAEIIGYTLEEISPTTVDTWARFSHPDDHKMSMDALRRHWLGEDHRYSIEFRMQHKNGTWIWVLATGQVVEHDEKGEPLRMVGTHLDITERKNAGLMLRQQQELLEQMSQLGRIGAWEVDLSTDKVFWSAMTREIHEVPADFVPDLESGIEFYKAGESRDAITAAVQQSIESGKPWNVELQLVTAKGNEIWVAAKGQPEFREGKCVRLFGSFQDIDARKTTERALIQAKNDAEAATQAKSEFLASMSHEIRTPMNGVIGMLDLLSKDDVSDAQKRKIQIAKSSAGSLLDLINDILDFSKVEAGKLNLENVDFDLHELMGDVAHAMAIKAEEKQLELILDLRKVPYSLVNGDPGRFRQIFVNLIGNAIKFTERGEIGIRCEVEEVANTLVVRGSVSDTGIGIPQAKQDALFDSFTQVDTSTTRKYGGTGLGLAIVKKLCNLMNGDIRVSSIEGSGSRFDFSVVLQKSRVICEGMVQHRFDDNKILLVDDNKSSREVLKDQLCMWGAEVTCAPTAKEAIAFAIASPFDTVLIDNNLPDMRGELLAQRLSTLADKDYQIILMGPMIKRQHACELCRKGIAAYINKPIAKSELERALSGQSATRFRDQEGAQTMSCPEPEVSKNLFSRDRKILVVEDNQINQEVVMGLLADLGLTADIANDGIEAIGKLANTRDEQSYNLVLMDCQMPNMDGYDTTRYIRQGKAGAENQKIPIMAMTANAMKGDREKCLSVGMDDYLSKPIDPDLLEKRLRYWLKVQTPLNIGAVFSSHTDTQDTENDTVWDQGRALQRVRHKDERLTTLVNMFVRDTPERVQQLRQAIAANDGKQTIHLAHTIKGVAGNLSALEVQKLSEHIELAAKSENWEDLESLAPEISRAFNTLATRLNAYLGSAG